MMLEIYLYSLILKKIKKIKKISVLKISEINRKIPALGSTTQVVDRRPVNSLKNDLHTTWAEPLDLPWVLLFHCLSSIFLIFKLSILGIIFGTLQSNAGIYQVLFLHHCPWSNTQKELYGGAANHTHTQSEMILHMSITKA